MASVHGITFDCGVLLPARLMSLGAVRLYDHALFDGRWTTFADVEGNEFDLIDANVRGRQ